MYEISSSQKVHSFTKTPEITLVASHLQNQSVDDLLDTPTLIPYLQSKYTFQSV